MKVEKTHPDMFMPFAITFTIESQFEADCLRGFFGTITNGDIAKHIKTYVNDFDLSNPVHAEIVNKIQEPYGLI